MAKWLADSTLELILTTVDNATRQCVCSGQPADFSGIAAVLLADNVITAGAGNGDWSAIANGDTSGRKITMAAQAGVTVDANGTATHITYDDGATLLWVTTCTSQALTSGNTVDIPAHDLEVADPV